MKQIFLASDFRYVASSIAKKIVDISNHKCSFIVTAIRDKERESVPWHEENKLKMLELGLAFDEYDLAGKSRDQVALDLDKYSTIYLEGGNPLYLLKAAIDCGFGDYLKKRLGTDLILIGMSAGSVVLGIDTAGSERPGHMAIDNGLGSTEGLGIVNFCIMPHWGKSNKKDDYRKSKIPSSYNEQYPSILLSDNQYVEVENGWCKIIDITKE